MMGPGVNKVTFSAYLTDGNYLGLIGVPGLGGLKKGLRRENTNVIEHSISFS